MHDSDIISVNSTSPVSSNQNFITQCCDRSTEPLIRVDYGNALILRFCAAYLRGISIWVSECAGKL